MFYDKVQHSPKRRIPQIYHTCPNFNYCFVQTNVENYLPWLCTLERAPRSFFTTKIVDYSPKKSTRGLSKGQKMIQKVLRARPVLIAGSTSSSLGRRGYCNESANFQRSNSYLSRLYGIFSCFSFFFKHLKIITLFFTINNC